MFIVLGKDLLTLLATGDPWRSPENHPIGDEHTYVDNWKFKFAKAKKVHKPFGDRGSPKLQSSDKRKAVSGEIIHTSNISVVTRSRK